MFFYPILSVLPQEFIYRVFFISRYREILGGERSMSLVNALAFAFLHIVFKNSLAVILTFIASFIFYRNYQRNHSLFWVSFEHYLYGAMIFSIGLGRFFYNGVH
ncbi:MAG TPA: CPBP family glutamic-type intramembrane protease [Victivallales bacterium]|nr:CPBP family glutamic-type intramembrane protease [Victivallales bacterium]HPO89651.1 CPBP family glutamic-type intramembrane protease [Victivallales bacterium]HRR05873.1 CPBP family glutamic-type intramembrane protease [Victivallales bacterium]